MRTEEDTRTNLGRQIAELGALLEVTKRLRRHFELDDLLTDVCTLACEVMRGEACSLVLEDQNSPGEYYFHAVKGGAEEIRGMSVKKGEGIVGWVIAEGQPVLVADASRDPRFNPSFDEKTKFRTRSVMVVPVQVEDETLGALQLLNKESGGFFDEDDLQFFSLMADQVAVAIKYVRSQEDRVASERMAAVGHMASTIIHDLKNPMTVIKGYAQLIPAVSRPADVSSYCNIIIDEVDRVVQMLREVLAYARGQVEFDLKTESIDELFASCAEVIRKEFAPFEIDVVLDIRHRGAVSMDGDKVRRMIENISTNAREAMPRGGRFTMSLERREDCAVMTLADTGCGMPQHVLKNLFVPFFSHGKENGTGLGMAIVRNIVEAHKGKISVDSEVGRGTSFVISLPVES